MSELTFEILHFKFRSLKFKVSLLGFKGFEYRAAIVAMFACREIVRSVPKGRPAMPRGAWVCRAREEDQHHPLRPYGAKYAIILYFPNASRANLLLPSL